MLEAFRAKQLFITPRHVCQLHGVQTFPFALEERVSFALEPDTLRFVFKLYLEIHIFVSY